MVRGEVDDNSFLVGLEPLDALVKRIQFLFRGAFTSGECRYSLAKIIISMGREIVHDVMEFHCVMK